MINPFALLESITMLEALFFLAIFLLVILPAIGFTIGFIFSFWDEPEIIVDIFLQIGIHVAYWIIMIKCGVLGYMRVNMELGRGQVWGFAIAGGILLWIITHPITIAIGEKIYPPFNKNGKRY